MLTFALDTGRFADAFAPLLYSSRCVATAALVLCRRHQLLSLQLHLLLMSGFSLGSRHRHLLTLLLLLLLRLRAALGLRARILMRDLGQTGGNLLRLIQIIAGGLVVLLGRLL